MSDKRLTLFELNHLVRDVLECEMPDEYWVEAELSECHESKGHCYMELIQKDERNATPIAKANAKCWASKWMLIRPYFERTTGERLRAGMKVLLKVYPQFHEAFGFSWIVTDIDPTYTLGDMARKRQEIIRQLKEEGVFDLQRELELPLFCQHIAVISSESAAGYGDFCHQLSDNPYGFQFQTQLFPAIMQGEGVSQSIISALENIYNAQWSTVNGPCSTVNGPLAQRALATNGTQEWSMVNGQCFDCVVIIRGGGATSDMSGFDTLSLAENVANFPLPIITGIGHDRDESILDMVSHTRVKTPTAAAAFLVDHLKGVLDTIEGAQSLITHYARQKLSTLQSQLATIQEILPKLFLAVKIRQDARIENLEARFPLLAERRLTAERHRLQLTEEKLKALDPQLLLKRGYSITLHNGKAVHNPLALKAGDEIETRLEKGTIKSIIK
jgi:exodeoxyribonuclease VII large subunit